MGLRRCCYGPRAAIVVASVGTLLCLTFSLTFTYLSAIISRIAANILVLKPGGIVYDSWSDVPFQIPVEFYVFNYTNVEDILSGNTSVKPRVQQLGPYTMGFHLTKVFDNFDEPPFVNYRMIMSFDFLPELSSGSLDDIVTIPNLLSILPVEIEDESSVAKIMDLLMKTHPDAEPPFVSGKVGDFLFYGQQDEALKQVQETLGFEMIPEGRFGFLYGQNATDNGIFKMDTGSENHNDMYQIVEWNGHNSTDFKWGDHYCGMINGSDGTMSYGVGKLDRMYIYMAVFRRSIYLDYVREIVFKGITLNEFEIPLEYYGDYNLNPDNLCYTDGNPEHAYASGVWYFGKAAAGSSIYISNPHFAGADFKLVEDIDGIHPMGHDHFTQMRIMPEFGAPLSADVRFQFNILMKPGEGMNQTSNWPTVMLPVLWANATVDLPDDYAAEIRKYYYGGTKLMYILLIVFIILTGFVALAGIFCSYKLMFQFRSELRCRGMEEYFRHEENSIENEENSIKNKEYSIENEEK